MPSSALRETAQGVTANGITTITFQAPHTGTIWTGSLSINNAAIGISWAITIGGLFWGQGQGAGPFGPIQAQSGVQVVLTSVGAGGSPGAYATLIGSIDPDDGSVPYVGPGQLPAPPAPSALLVYTGVVPVGSGTIVVTNVAAPDALGLMLITNIINPAVLNISVKGTTSGAFYGDGFNFGAANPAFLPYNSSADPQVDLVITNTTPGAIILVYAVYTNVDALVAAAASLGQSNTPPYGLLIGGNNAGNFIPMAVDASGRSMPVVANQQAGLSVANGGILLAAPAAGTFNRITMLYLLTAASTMFTNYCLGSVSTANVFATSELTTGNQPTTSLTQPFDTNQAVITSNSVNQNGTHVICWANIAV